MKTGFLATLLVALSAGLARPAHADADASVAAEAPPEVASGRVELSLAPALMSYGEHLTVVDGSSTTLGARLAGRAGVRVGRRVELALDGAWLRQPRSGMEWTVQGQRFQKNQFAMDVVDAGVGVRFRLAARQTGDVTSEWYLTAGYRFSRLALHLSQVELADGGTPLIDHANETQLVHALPVELEHVHTSGGFRYGFRAVLGPSYATASNDAFSGPDFSGSGLVAAFSPSIAWRAGAGWLTLAVGLELREQEGSSPETVTLAGSEMQAQWPPNRTWIVPLALGYAWEAGR